MDDVTEGETATQIPEQPRTLRGEDARRLILGQIKAHNEGLLATLGKYHAAETIRTWHETIRAIEEFINVPLFGVDDENVVRWLLSVRLDGTFLQNPSAVWMSVKAALTPHDDEGGRASMPSDLSAKDCR